MTPESRKSDGLAGGFLTLGRLDRDPPQVPQVTRVEIVEGEARAYAGDRPVWTMPEPLWRSFLWGAAENYREMLG